MESQGILKIYKCEKHVLALHAFICVCLWKDAINQIHCITFNSFPVQLKYYTDLAQDL